jgi:homoserine dehydrogenase
MPLLNDIHSIVFPAASATSATFTAYTFTEVYAGASATPVINGISVTMAAGSSVKIKVRSISNGTNCYLLGETIDNQKDSPIFQ